MPRQRHASTCVHARAGAWGGVCTHACERACPGCPPPPRRLTSRKQSCSSENSGSLCPTAKRIASRVCAEAAQRVCVNLLNSGCDRRGRMCGRALRRKGGQPRARTHMQTGTLTHSPAQGHGALKDSQGTQAELGSGFPDRKWKWGRCTLLQGQPSEAPSEPGQPESAWPSACPEVFSTAPSKINKFLHKQGPVLGR